MATVLSIASRRDDNLSDAALIDLFGEAKEHAGLLGKRLDDLKAQIKERGLDTGMLGDVFELKVSSSRYDQLDSKLIKAAMPESWVVKHSKPVSPTSISAKRRPVLSAACS